MPYRRRYKSRRYVSEYNYRLHAENTPVAHIPKKPKKDPKKPKKPTDPVVPPKKDDKKKQPRRGRRGRRVGGFTRGLKYMIPAGIAAGLGALGRHMLPQLLKAAPELLMML